MNILPSAKAVIIAARQTVVTTCQLAPLQASPSPSGRGCREAAGEG